MMMMMMMRRRLVFVRCDCATPADRTDYKVVWMQRDRQTDRQAHRQTLQLCSQ